MATLLKSIDDIKKYVSVNKNIKFPSIEPYVKQAERKYIKPLVGKLIYDDYVTTVPTEEIEIEVYDLLREASANLSWFIYLPLANVNVTDGGISVSEGADHKSAQWWQFNDLKRSLVDAGFAALDEALKILEANEEDFVTWTQTESYTVFNELFVKRTDTFNTWYNINNSRRIFLALRPLMKETHHQYYKGMFSTTTLNTIHTSEEADAKEVLELLQASQVNFTIAKAAKSGAFLFTPTGISLPSEELPVFKKNLLSIAEKETINREKLTQAEEFLKAAVTIIKSNTTLFPEYSESDTVTFVEVKNTKSLLSI